MTLFESQIILAEHECCTNWGDFKSNKSNQMIPYFLHVSVLFQCYSVCCLPCDNM